MRILGWTACLQYQITANQMIYGLVSRGYKAGGVNSDPALVSEDREFDTELMWNFEAGLKGRWLEDRLQAQVSAFYQKRDDIQIKQSLVQSRDRPMPLALPTTLAMRRAVLTMALRWSLTGWLQSPLPWFGSLGLLSAEFDIPLSETLNSRSRPMHPTISLL